MPTTKNYFITIAGNIGVGKSTLVSLLAQREGWTPYFEGFADNPYLSDFYGDMERWSFHSQIFFLSQRLQQHHRLLQQRNNTVIQDRSVYEDAAIFARNLFEQGHISDRDWSTYQSLYQTLAQLLPPPHLVVYLKASIPILQKRIAQRGRTYEQSIDATYLSRLNRLYNMWAQNFDLCPVLTVETDNLNVILHDAHLEQISQRIQERLIGKDYLVLEDKNDTNRSQTSLSDLPPAADDGLHDGAVSSGH